MLDRLYKSIVRVMASFKRRLQNNQNGLSTDDSEHREPANATQSELQQVKQELNDTQTQLDESHQQLSQTKAELQETHNNLTVAEQATNKIQTELNILKGEASASGTLRYWADKIENEFEQLKTQLSDVEDRLQETEELRRTGLTSMKQRYERQIDEIKQHARDDSVKTMFQIADETNRALEIADSTPDVDSVWLSGLQITNDNINKLISEQGYERFAQVGDQFDPALHNATQTVETSKYPNRTITQVFTAGYRNLSSDAVVRHAQVVVAVAPLETNSSSPHNCCEKPINANIANQEEQI